MLTRKFIIPLLLICFVFMLSACSSGKKQETPPSITSAGEQAPAPSQADAQTDQNGQSANSGQASGKVVADDKAGQKESAVQSKPVVTKGQSTQENAAGSTSGQANAIASVQNSQSEPAAKVETNASLPSKVYVFTNTSGCCEATRQKYEQHSQQVKTVESKYASKVAFTWLDVGQSDVAYQKELQQIAKNFGVKSLPSIVVVDANGNVLLKQAGPLNMAEVDKVFGGIS